MKFFLSIIFYLLIKIKTIETFFDKDDFKDSLEVYDKLNYFETNVQNQSFIINSAQKSIAYFDSFDKNSIIYISQKYDDFISHKDERITGKFYLIEPNTTYYIRTFLFASPSVLKKYVYPLNLNDNEIMINDEKEEINFLYLEKNKNYILNFEENKNKKMIKLSHKTLNSKIKIIINDIEEAELNQNEHYYVIKENFKGKIKLEIEENNAFLEFLSDYGEYQIFTKISYEKNEVNNDILIINILKTQKNFELYLYSDKPFNCSLSYGFSNISNYYYYSRHNKKINSMFIKESNYNGYASLIGAFSNENLSKDEFISYAVILERTSNQKIYLKYGQSSDLDKLYDEEMSEENCTKIIDNLKDVIEMYVYSDIAQNPPEIPGFPNYHHKRINLTEELDKVSKVKRKFYEFYQEIQKILTSTRDLHFNIYAHQTPKGIQFGQYRVVIPFNFEVRKHKGKYRIFIKKNIYYDYLQDNNKVLKDFIEAHLEIPLNKINDIEIFEYIQNWSKYRQTKNEHAQFSNIIDVISDFYLCNYPVDYSDLYNEYIFDDNKSIKMWYFNNFQNINENNVEFNNYFLKVFKSQKAPFQLPPFDEIKDRFLISKGLKKEKIKLKNEKIKWDILYEENDGRQEYLKCRFDEENKVNVLIQNTFGLNFYNASEKVLDCARLFYSNEYPLIIIEDHNNGGFANLYMLMHQILQIRTVDRSYESFKLSDISKKYFNSKKWDFIDIETCNRGKSFNDINETIDHYGDIEHKRTKVIDRFPRQYRNALNNFREEYFHSKNIKNPTDIIIFTDSFSYSASSSFIKGFQSTGGAIVVGYYGNPTKEGTDFFDASQSDSEVQNLESSEMYKNLNNLGFTIIGVTCGESYDDFYQNKNPIPREYTLEPVDYRVDIYSHYSDDIYQEFIKEGLEVHKLFNNGSYCNSKNDKLLFHVDKCDKIDGDPYAHGGYRCNNESQWDKGNCETYYCDIGYYYDHFKNECTKECPFEENTKYFLIHEKKYNNKYIIEENMTYQFIILPNENYYYSFETEEESINILPKVFFLKGSQNINILNNNKTLPVTIKSVNPNLNPNINMHIYYVRSLEFNILYFEKGKHMYFLQSINDSNFYINNILHRSKGIIKLAKYNNTMESEDIIKINNKYFYDISDKIWTLEKNNLYLIYFDFEDYEEVNFYFTPINNELIELSDFKNILYLEKNKNYILDFVNNTVKNMMLKLSRKTLNSEVIIANENIILNSNNLYYIFNDTFKGKLNLKIGNENALIEILFKQDDNLTDIIDLEGKTKIHLNKQFNFIKIPKKYASKPISFNFNKEENYSIISIYHDYTIPGYSLFYSLNNVSNGILLNNYNFDVNEHYKNDINLMENEFYCLIIQTIDKDFNIDIDINMQKEDNKKDQEIKTWQIILIIIGSIIILLLIIILIFYCINKKKKITNKDIEDKAQSLTEIEI